MFNRLTANGTALEGTVRQGFLCLEQGSHETQQKPV
jgi:hypothetical protein